MAKKLVLKKVSVLRDELKQRGSGLYCFLPFENGTKKDDKSIYKIGLTIKEVHERLEQYHSYFPMGVYICALLLKPTKLKRGRTLTVYYQEIEEFLFRRVKELGAAYIYSSTRVRKNGRTEWVYANDNEINQAFLDAHEKYGGRVDINTTQEKQMEARALKKRKKVFVAEISYPTSGNP